MHTGYDKNGYLLVQNFFDVAIIELLQEYYKIKYQLIKYYKSPKIAPVTSVVASGYNYYADTLTESISANNLHKVSDLLKINLLPTYTFTRIYEKNDILTPHIDRHACEISATCPIITSNDSPSIIYISNYTFDRKKDKAISTLQEVKKRGDYSEVKLQPGDALFYKGCERYHWREPLKEDLLIQFFMHYVDKNGVNNEWHLNKRPFLGFYRN
jgi:hypothetical protein